MNAVDTNIMVYAFDLDEAIRGPRAVELLESLPVADTVLLWQVACETGSVLRRINKKGRRTVDPEEAERAMLARYPLVCPPPATYMLAQRIRAVHQVSLWDSLLIAACHETGVTTLYSEDIQSRTEIEGVRIVSPF